MSDIAGLIEECRKLPKEIAGAAEAIAHFSAAVSKEELERDSSGRWRPPHHNFITMKPQVARAKSLAVTLRGNADEFEIGDHLKLVRDQAGYSAFRLESASQIADAFGYIKRALTLYSRGRSRDQKTPKTIG